MADEEDIYDDKITHSEFDALFGESDSEEEFNGFNI